MREEAGACSWLRVSVSLSQGMLERPYLLHLEARYCANLKFCDT